MIKRKYDTLISFKVYQNKVGNQSGKKIKKVFDPKGNENALVSSYTIILEIVECFP